MTKFERIQEYWISVFVNEENAKAFFGRNWKNEEYLIKYTKVYFEKYLLKEIETKNF